MNDIEAAEHVLAQLQYQRDRATARVNEIASARQACAYAVHAGGNEKAQAELDTLNRQLAEFASMIENIDGARNFGRVLGDFLNTFDKHAIAAGDWRITECFYRDGGGNREYERKLLTKYESHVDLVNELMYPSTQSRSLIIGTHRDPG